MALSPRLDLRQTQSLVMTPQLQQAIKLLALSNLEIESFIDQAIADNPLLELGETDRPDPSEAAENTPDRGELAPADQLIAQGQGEADAPLDIDPSALDRDRDTGDWSAAPASGASFDELPDIGERGEPEPTLAQHLEAQLGAAARDPAIRFIAMHIVGRLDEAGYLTATTREIAGEIGCTVEQCEQALAIVQSLEPTGVGARSLSECLMLQAKEADRYDPCMARLIDNLDLVARGAFPQLRRMCQVDEEDFLDMLAELRSYDPKPGLKFGSDTAAAVVPDILITPGGENGWRIALNQDTLPRLVVNREYYLEMREGCDDRNARSWLSEKLADANALVKALDQRQKTVLKVTQEIVRHQAEFFRRGVSGLKPLTLRMVAEAIEMHESTVSRVTSNKYLHCQRGTFELKYFFSSGVGSTEGEDGASAEAVKAQIRALVDAEDPKKILSDDKLVELLKAKGFDLARRTVAKYREAIGIGSSVQRRRQKKLEGVR